MGATAPGRGCCGTPGVRATGWGRRAAPVLRQQPCGSHLSLAPGSVLSRSAIGNLCFNAARTESFKPGCHMRKGCRGPRTSVHYSPPNRSPF